MEKIRKVMKVDLDENEIHVLLRALAAASQCARTKDPHKGADCYQRTWLADKLIRALVR